MERKVLAEFAVDLVDLVDELHLELFGAGDRLDEEEGGLLTEFLALQSRLFSSLPLLPVLPWSLQSHDLSPTHHLSIINSNHFFTRPSPKLPLLHPALLISKQRRISKFFQIGPYRLTYSSRNRGNSL